MGVFGYIVLAAVILFLLKRYVNVSVKQSVSDASRNFHGKVVGVTFDNSDGTSRQALIKKHCRAGMAIELRPEPNNPADPNAVGVWLPAGQIGYIEGGRLAGDLSDHLRAGNKITVEVSNVTGGTSKRPTFGVNIFIHIWQ